MSVHLLEDQKSKNQTENLLCSLNRLYEKGGWRLVYDTLIVNMSKMRQESYRHGIKHGFWTAVGISGAIGLTIYFLLK